jgi:hypothetical protein
MTDGSGAARATDVPGASPAPGRARRPLLLALAVVVLAIGAVGIAAFAPGALCACSPTLPPLPPSPVVGVVTTVDSSSLGVVQHVTLRLTDGQTASLQIGVLENATEFPPGHLAEHQVSSEPVRAFYRLDAAGAPIVYRLEDAG